MTVLDLRRRLRLEETPRHRGARGSCSTEVESGEVLGLLVDEVRQVMRLTENEIEPASAVLGGDVSRARARHRPARGHRVDPARI